jgi:mycothiol synthase
MCAKLTIRNCDPQDPRDAAAYEQLKEGEAFVHLLSRPDYRVDKNLFYAEVSGIVVSYINVLPELGIERAVLDYGIAPSYSLEPIIGELLDRALERARELGVRIAHVSLPLAGSTKTKSLSKLLSKLGFNEVCLYYELKLDVPKVGIASAGKSESEFQHLGPGEEGTLAQIQNRCFAGTWGYNPNTIEDIAWQLKAKKNCPEDVILATDKGEIIGYCWAVTEHGRDSSTGRSQGRIYMLGVDPNYRRKGWGRKLLLAGMSYLKSKGCEIIKITVHSQNVAAMALYHSSGFRLHGETVWLEKAIH